MKKVIIIIIFIILMALIEILEDTRDRILNYLFNENETKIELWLNNKKIKINDNFEPLLQGDWTRYPKENRLNLNSILHEKITKNEIFNSIIKELKIPSSKGNYSKNFNPNWFFIFYEEFISENIFEEIKDYNDKIIGIQFINSKYRPEIIKIIELHSRFIINSNFTDLLGSDKFFEYFIKGCYIQYKIVDNIFQNKYLDLCYIIKDYKLLLEIDEYHHNEIIDYNKKMNLMISSQCRLVNYNINDCYMTNDKVFENLVKSFCKIIYHNELKIEAIKLYLIEINKMEIGMINVGVSIINSELKLKLSDILSLPFFDSSNKLLLDKIIEDVIKKGNIYPSKDFHQIYKKDITLENLIKDKKKLELTSFGIKNWLLSIDGIYWSRRKDYIDFMDELERQYYLVIENIIKDDDIGQLQQQNQLLKNIIGLKKYNAVIFFEKVKEKKLFNNKLHNTVPFIIKEDKSYIDYELLSAILSEEINRQINTNDFIKDKGIPKYIPNYRLIYPSELSKIYNNDFID